MDLKECRKAAGVRPAEIARQLGCPRETVSQIENGCATLESAQAYLAAIGWQLVAVPAELAPEVERLVANGGHFGPTNFSGAMDELLDADASLDASR